MYVLSCCLGPSTYDLLYYIHVLIGLYIENVLYHLLHFIITAYVLFLLYFVLINLLYYFTNCTYCCIVRVRTQLIVLFTENRLAQIMRVRFSNPDSQTHVLKLRFSTPILKLRFSNLDSQTQILNLGFSKSQILKMGFPISDSQLQILKIRCSTQILNIRCSTQILNFGFSKSQIPQNQILKIRHCLARRDRNQG